METQLRAQLDSLQAKYSAATEQAAANDTRANLLEQQCRELGELMNSTVDELDAVKRRVKNLTFAVQDKQVKPIITQTTRLTQ